ncbi:MAG: glucosamine-6-phosphate deaminase [Flavobacteriaceae bacterium]|jgi:glucosamine-6-phosphate deaminase|nr:glucosamine-6-phosphate deaminase [Flavobacteriaceae bacterium]
MKEYLKPLDVNYSGKQAVKVYASQEKASSYVAQRIAKVIVDKQQQGNHAVLGLATGSTPKGVYQELIRLHQYEGLSFENVITFNLDEYYPIHPVEEQSYVAFMKNNLFNHINIKPQHVHIPDGTLSLEAIEAYCHLYEQKIADYGGLDLQLLGIGRTGHIGFNEPGALLHSTTRLVTLNDLTREDASNDFGGKESVPTQAITMGIKTITEAKEVILMALSNRKAEIVKKALQGDISSEVPATFLQEMNHVEYIFDQEAAALL